MKKTVSVRRTDTQDPRLGTMGHGVFIDRTAQLRHEGEFIMLLKNLTKNPSSFPNDTLHNSIYHIITKHLCGSQYRTAITLSPPRNTVIHCTVRPHIR